MTVECEDWNSLFVDVMLCCVFFRNRIMLQIMKFSNGMFLHYRFNIVNQFNNKCK